ncbi:MAG TPA: NAD(P)/FAD-dependent oxidoreductase [Polyangiaceae bacterium]|nr:NAD(P)/FAD-dependent oxidoreductase [Polyangiaceae bacterium]
MSRGVLDVAVVGGGPAGLAVAIETARRGLKVAIFERQDEPVDKACGEGIMPPGVRALDALGVRSRLLPGESAEFRSIRYIDSDGTSAEGKLPAPGLAVRRVALVRAMSDRAREVGADLRFGCTLLSHRCAGAAVLLETDRGPEAAQILVAADGLASRLRHEQKLDVPRAGPRRFGLRRHFRCTPWTSSIEIHLAMGAEAYVTPVSTDCVGVAFLWAEATNEGLGESRWESLQRLFPRLAARLEGAIPCSRIRGAGPLDRASRARTSDRFALVGDAAGYIDAITGEGISLSLLSSVALARILPDALRHGASRAALAPYERDFARLFRRYAFATRGVLAVVRRPALRREILRVFRRFPRSFDWLVGQVVDA